MKIIKFEDLECWQEAKKLVNMVYEAINGSEKFKRDYRLRDQTTAAEVQSILYVAVDQNYLSKETFDKIYSQADKVSKISPGFIKYLFKQPNNSITRQRNNEKVFI